MISFVKRENILVLRYQPMNGASWIFDEYFSEGEPYTIRRTFTVSQEHLVTPSEGSEVDDVLGTVDRNGLGPEDYDWVDLSDLGSEGDAELDQDALGLDHDEDMGRNDDYVCFAIAVLENGYYKFDQSVLDIDVDLYMQQDMDFQDRFFTAPGNLSIFRIMSKLVRGDIRIGDGENDVPKAAFLSLIKNFPTRTEIQKYTFARVSDSIRNYVNDSVDARAKYEKYMNRRVRSLEGDDLVAALAGSEKAKYEAILEKLKSMLSGVEGYTEKQWQREILQIITLIYPKYICVVEEADIRDVYHSKVRRLDFMLVDSNGNIDIAEIKKPTAQSIVSLNTYRDNYIPVRELSGTVMQVEKYLYYLNKWGREGEVALTRRHRSVLPQGFEIKIINPNGIIIMGRENTLTAEQLDDLEVIKRKYKSIIDIFTYDELVRRVERLLQKFSVNLVTPAQSG